MSYIFTPNSFSTSPNTLLGIRNHFIQNIHFVESKIAEEEMTTEKRQECLFELRKFGEHLDALLKYMEFKDSEYVRRRNEEVRNVQCFPDNQLQFECLFRGNSREVADKLYRLILGSPPLANEMGRMIHESLMMELERKNQYIIQLERQRDPTKSIQAQKMSKGSTFPLDPLYAANRNIKFQIPIAGQDWAKKKIEATLMYKHDKHEPFVPVEDGIVAGSVVQSSDQLIEFKHLKLNKMKPINHSIFGFYSQGIRKKSNFYIQLKVQASGKTKISTPFQIVSRKSRGKGTDSGKEGEEVDDEDEEQE